MLERMIIDGIPIYVDQTTNIAYIYDSEQIRIGICESKHLLLDADWKERVADRFQEWLGATESKSRKT